MATVNEFVLARKSAGLDQGEFGELVDYSAGRISQLESDPDSMPLRVAQIYYRVASDGIKRDIKNRVESFIFA